MKNQEITADQIDSDVDKLFSKVTIETSMDVVLPSKGKFYKSFKGARVNPLTFQDEQKILLSRAAGSDPINEILERCVQGVEVAELLAMDKIFLLMKVREISYGSIYKFEIPCPKCNEVNKVHLDLCEEMPVRYIPDDLVDPQEIELPVLRVKAKVRLPRNFEMHYLEGIEDSVTNTFRFVKEIDGNSNPIFIQKVLSKMHIRDRKVISQVINASDYGLDSKFQFICAACNNSQILGVPFTASFFSVT